MKKKILSVFLVLCLIFTLLPVSALADTTASGKCGDNLTWTLKNGTLTISGTGEMNGYYSSPNSEGAWVTSAPWGQYYKSIKSVVIEEGVTSIGNSAFYGCSSLTSVTIGNGVTSIGNYAFKDCESLTNITIPDSVMSIGNSAFYNCSSLINMTIPDGVTSIGYSTFYNCSSLTSMTIGNGVTSIDSYVFYGCKSIMDIYYTGNVSSWLGIRFSDPYSSPCYNGAKLYFKGKLVTDVVIPNTVKSIGGFAFSGCRSLENVTISNGITSIGSSAFSGCSNLRSVKIPNSVKSIEYSAFSGCSNLERIAIPDSVASIQNWAFSGCTSLKKITIPKSVTAIAYGSFKDCSSLASVSVPTSVKKIDGRAFQACDSLKNVYYSGSSTQWKSISIDKWCNGDLLNAKIHYNYVAAPVIKITTSSGKPKISWSAVDGATKYYIYRSTDGKTYKQYTTTTKTSYTNTNAKIGTTYYYKVKAAKVVNDKTVKSAYSNVKSIKCTPAAPVVSISRSNGKPKLTWKAVTGASKYYIYRSTDGKTYKQYTTTTKTTYTNTGAASGKKYYYKVKAVAVVNKKNVFSAYSTAKNLMTTLATPSVSITTANGKPKITWKAVTGADKYIVYRSTDGKTFKQLSTTTKTSLTNTGAKKNTKYYYKVKAVCTKNTNANSALSKAVSIKATK